MSHTFSKTWTSDAKKERDAHRVTMSTVQRALSLHSVVDNVPWTFQAWIAQKLAVQQDRIAMATRVAELRRLTKTTPPISIAPFGGKPWRYGQRTAVLSQPTCFTPQYDRGRRLSATLWPTADEFEFEGPGRARTGFGRKLPLMRDRARANETVSWKIMEVIKPLQFDYTDRPPTWEDVHEAVDEISDEDGAACVGRDLLAVISSDAIYRI